LSDHITQQVVELIRENGSVVQVLCSLDGDSLICVSGGDRYVVPFDVSLPRTLESLRRQLEVQFASTLHYRHCLHCIQYSSSGMALQMAQGKVGVCKLHTLNVSPLFACNDFFSYWDFRPMVVPELPLPDPIESLEDCLGFLGASEQVSVYRYGTAAARRSSTEVSKRLCDTWIRSVVRHPRSITIALHSSGVRFANLRSQKVFTAVTASDLAKWQESQEANIDMRIFPNPRVREQLGLNQLVGPDRQAAVIAWLRLWRDAHELEPVASSE
jgi:hypothetical protein